ncbi:interleukin-10 receptor subunit alpha [Polyodon spathula]|uniref:interleukin-10 receptor subunit alpha n=1 Tax=Polyodon spathula TaxID=7913 RepID=UPI001B7F0CDA|nr:interleukin-10 receptor subunit alpha [Polyodon spathula]
MAEWNWVPVVFAILRLCCSVAGQDLRPPRNLTVVSVNTRVVLLWAPPEGAPQAVQYNVLYKRYDSKKKWNKEKGCQRTNSTSCDLSNKLTQREAFYLARVRTVFQNWTSDWAITKRFQLRDTVLEPPGCDVTVTVHSFLVRLSLKTSDTLLEQYPSGLKFSIHLRHGHQDSKKFVLKEDEMEMELEKYVQGGESYCVSTAIQDISGLGTWLSEEKCVLVPIPESPVTSLVIVFSVLGLLTLLSLSLLSLHLVLKRPAALPSVLKSLRIPESGWTPLVVGDVPLERVFFFSERMWFLTEGKDERGSCNSGVSLEQCLLEAPRGSARGGGGEGRGEANGSTAGLQKDTDSGCVSLGQCSLEEGKCGDSGTSLGQGGLLKEDSGVSVGLSPLLENTEVLECSIQVQDCGYRSQLPQTLLLSLPEPMGDSHSDCEGYRPGFRGCVCSGSGDCFLCRLEGHCGQQDTGDSGTGQLRLETEGVQSVREESEEDRQSHAAGGRKELLACVQNALQHFSNGYLKKTAPRLQPCEWDGAESLGFGVQGGTDSSEPGLTPAHSHSVLGSGRDTPLLFSASQLPFLGVQSEVLPGQRLSLTAVELTFN